LNPDIIRLLLEQGADQLGNEYAQFALDIGRRILHHRSVVMRIAAVQGKLYFPTNHTTATGIINSA
jgi:hypothetical protein